MFLFPYCKGSNSFPNTKAFPMKKRLSPSCPKRRPVHPSRGRERPSKRRDAGHSDKQRKAFTRTLRSRPSETSHTSRNRQELEQLVDALRVVMRHTSLGRRALMLERPSRVRCMRSTSAWASSSCLFIRFRAMRRPQRVEQATVVPTLFCTRPISTFHLPLPRHAPHHAMREAHNKQCR